MNFPKISIITPSYNQGHFIEQTICSILDQGYSNLEYIIMDGGSTDNTVEIIKKYEKHLSYWVSEKDKGQSDAINKGFKIVTGEIVNWLNSDDYYEPGTLEHVANQFENKNITAYCGRSRIFSATTERFSTGTDIYPSNLAKTMGWARIDQPETFFRKSVWDTIGFLNETCHYVMDKDFWTRYLSKYGLEGIVQDDKVIANFRLHDGSKTVSVRLKFQEETRNLFYSYALDMGLKEYEQIYKELFSVSEIPLEYKSQYSSKELWLSVFNYSLFQEGVYAYAQNNYPLAKLIFKKIKPDLLQTVDVAKLSSISNRIKYLPVALKKIINSLRS